MTLKAVMRYCG